MTDLRFDGRVAIVTGAGHALGRSHALLLASRGAKVVVSDEGSRSAVDAVVELVRAAGGEAIANYGSVEDGNAIVSRAFREWNRLDIVVHGVETARAASAEEMASEALDTCGVHGRLTIVKAARAPMLAAGYGRIIITANAASLGLVGFVNALALEGREKNVHTNMLVPVADASLVGDAALASVSPLICWLVHDRCEESGSSFEVDRSRFAKLRWESREGKSFALVPPVTPEQLQKNWVSNADLDPPEHPNSQVALAASARVDVKFAECGSALIDAQAALGFELQPQTSSYDERDVALYALGIGAIELPFVYEQNNEGFRPLPTFGVVPAMNLLFGLAKRGPLAPGLNYGFERILHLEQYTEVKRPLPPHATLTHRVKIKDIWDKGRSAVVVTVISSSDEAGNELIYNEVTTFVRGAGGWGGDRGPARETNDPPDRAPDATVTEKISELQALVYRLSGDDNPLHVDPAFAKSFGFDRPILHGLCTFGYAARHVIKSFCDDDPRYFKSIRARFSEIVFPGDTLITEMWKEGVSVFFRCKVKARGRAVITDAIVHLYEQIPAL